MTGNQSNMKRYIIAFFIECLLTVLIMIFYYHKFNLLSFVNALSLTALILLIVGLIVWIVQGGFFDGFIFGFKIFNRASRKRKAAKLGLDDYEADDDPRMSQHSKWSMSFPLIIMSLIFFVISFLLSFTLF
ncbi:DUF3899 domain-containing protein [Scopulibacillus cellulosilyticus]|uniref:DUF3899 domain-containing protein n=1 Tax=Scopulibacillus cellulosilyticus TaxID=2665665 RepID=A0ABW2PXT7_9BACL